MNEEYELDNLVYKWEMERKREGGRSVSYHQTIYNPLRKAGRSETGALDILGRSCVDKSGDTNYVAIFKRVSE